jgi:hypothetical protein
VLFARFHRHMETVEGTFTDPGLQNFPVPATCVGLLVTAYLASLPDGTLVSLVLLGEIADLVVGAAFCALALEIPPNTATAAAKVMRAVIMFAPFANYTPRRRNKHHLRSFRENPHLCRE